MPLKVYRYSTTDHPNGKVLTQRGDHYSRLTGTQKLVEDRIRALSPDWKRKRAESLYTWHDKEFATCLWKNDKKLTHLFELEVEGGDIEHWGDLSWYSMMEDFLRGPQKGEDYALRNYVTELQSRPRIEILVKKAIVVAKLYDVSEK